MRKAFYGFLFAVLLLPGCTNPDNKSGSVKTEVPFVWDNASIYFLLTDRFNNGDPDNDINFERSRPTAVLRGFEGGDIRGITMKIEEGYFNDLGANVLWFTPVREQIKGIVNEGTGDTYGFHGYWTRDWTSLDPNFGTEDELKELIREAHERGIRVIMDVILNHTGPVTDRDPVWPGEWVRTEPKCDFESYKGMIPCTLVDNLPDIRTESNEPVELPAYLLEKWLNEGRLDQELAELDDFFNETGFPRVPRYYIMKWIIDLIREYGIDGFRIDTARHVEESVWADLRKLADKAFAEWKADNPEKVMDQNGFYMVGEAYHYKISSTFDYDFGDRKVNYFENGLSSLINFEFKEDVLNPYEKIFSKYSGLLNGDFKEFGTVNYISSHDDLYLPDLLRENPLEMGTKLLLCPGTVQIYYGDETSRRLDIPGAEGDATLRSFMNWDELSSNVERSGFYIQDVLEHWQKIGSFRADHPSVGAGVHKMISEDPYIFTRKYQDGNYSDEVLVGLNLGMGPIKIDVEGLFEDRTILREYYSGQEFKVKKGIVEIDLNSGIILLGEVQGT